MSLADNPELEQGQQTVPGEETPSEIDALKSEAGNESPELQAGDDGEGTPEQAEAEETKRRNGFERRIQKLNSKIADRDRLIDDLLKRVSGPSTATTPAQAPSDKPKLADYNDIEAYTEALTDWKLAQVERKAESRKADQAVVTYRERVAKFAEVHPDFDEVLDDVSHIPLSNAVTEFVRDSDVGPEVIYELAQNPSELLRISKLSAVRQVAELGKWEDRIVGKSKPQATTPAKKASGAPAPLKTNSGKSGTVKVRSLDDPDLPYSEFLKIRAEQEKARRSR